MSKIFISHSKLNDAAALAVAQWLTHSGWPDYFLDITPAQGIAPGERWQEALKNAADRCEAVLFLISPAWLASRWCLAEFLLAKQLGKTIFGILIEAAPLEALPREMTGEWQLCDLVSGSARQLFKVAQQPMVADTEVSFAADGLTRLRIGLQRAGLDPASFPWPPPSDPNRLPYRGLKALDAEDAAIFFGREAAIVRGLDALRGFRDRGIEHLFVILGASGAGKSSFLRAGLWPRLQRDERHFLPLPVIRPERAVICGAAGLAASLEAAYRMQGAPRSRATINATLNQAGGPQSLLAGLQALATARLGENAVTPAVVIAIDQGEELFGTDGGPEAVRFLTLLEQALSAPAQQRPVVIVAIRSDSYERLQAAPQLAQLVPFLFSLPPVSSSEFKAVIEGPARRYTESGHSLSIDSKLTERLVRDTEGADALPLLAFTMERLLIEHGGDGRLTLENYEALGGVRGSIEAAVETAFMEPGREPAVPADKTARDRLLRAAFIPWLARVDPETEEPKRRVVSWDEIPAEARPLLDRLIEQRLLVRDRRKLEGREDAVVVEVAHEALLRQWPLLTEWLREDAQALKALDAVLRAAAEWEKNRHPGDPGESWLVHTGERLTATEVLQRPDFARLLRAEGQAYLQACRARDDRQQQERRARIEADRLAKERELVQAKALAEAEHNRANAQAAARVRQRRLSVALLSLLLVALVTVWYGQRERREAENQQRVAESGELAADSLGMFTTAPELSLWLAVEAASISRATDGTVAPKIQDALHRALQSDRTRLTLRIHAEIAAAVAYSPNGTLVAVGQSAGLNLWDAASGREVPTTFESARGIVAVTFSPDGKRLLAGDRFGGIGLWDVASGRLLKSIPGHQDIVWSIAVSPDGRHLATASQDSTAKLWELDSWRPLRTLTGHSKPVFAITFSPDGRLLATASADGSAAIWDATSGAQRQRMAAGQTVHGVAFSADGKRLATVDTAATTVRFWEVASGKELTPSDGHRSSVFNLAYSPDGRRLATVSLDKTAKIWSVASGEELLTLAGHTDSVVSVAFSPDGRRLITGASDGTARIWDVGDVTELPALTGHHGDIRQVVYSPDGKRLATASEDATARIWDAQTGRELLVIDGHHAAVNGLAFSPDGKRIATAGADKSARIVDSETGRELLTLSGHGASVSSVAFSTDGHRLATGSADKTARVWDSSSGRELAALSSEGEVSSVAFAPDGSRLALGIKSNPDLSPSTRRLESAQVWDWSARKSLLHFEADFVEVPQVVFSKDGRHLATAGSSPPFAVGIWNPSAPQSSAAMLLRHPVGVLSVAFSPDTTLLVSGGYYSSVKVWDPGDGRELMDLPGGSEAVYSVAFSPDGKHLATAGSSRTVRVYALDPEELLTLARSRLTSDISDEECRRYLRRQSCAGTGTARIVAGNLLMKSGDTAAALTAFRDGLRSDGISDTTTQARRLLATLLAAEGTERAELADLVQARKDFLAAAALDPPAHRNPQRETVDLVSAAQERTAQRLMDKQQWGAAIDILRSALDLDPQNETAARQLAQAYNWSDQPDKAIAIMRKVAATRPTYANLLELANDFRMRDDYAHAMELLNQAASLDPGNQQAHAELGRVLRLAGQPDRAIAELDTAIKLSPTGFAYVERARAHAARSQFPLAFADFSAAKKLNSEYSYAYVQAAMLDENLHDFESAYTELKKAVALDAGEAANFAEACLISGHLDEARHTAEELLESAPGETPLDVAERLAVRFVYIAALVLQGDHARVQTERAAMATYMKTLGGFKQDWDYGATKKFLTTRPMPGADRAMLLQLLDEIEQHQSSGASPL